MWKQSSRQVDTPTWPAGQALPIVDGIDLNVPSVA